MFEVSLEQWLQFLRSQGRDLEMPTPPECVALWERAKREGGFHLGKLFVLKAPLRDFTGATYNRRTGDTWIWHEGQAPRHTVQRLFRMLVHAKHPNYEPPRTVEEDWEREADTWRQARQLVLAWDQGDDFTEEELAEELATIERFCERHLEATVLAGSRNPALARAAYDALALVGWQREWDTETFEAALGGYAEREADNIAAVMIDRQGLRGSWSMLGDEAHSAAEGLDLPLDGASASLLRSALSALASEQQPQPHKFVRHRWGSEEHRDLCFLTFNSQFDLKDILRHAFQALLAYPEASAFARWTVFSMPADEQGPARIYRLRVEYKPDDRRQRLPSAELWLLSIPERARDLVAEAAWQGFIRSWLKVTGVRQETLREGHQELWGVLGYAGLQPEEN